MSSRDSNLDLVIRGGTVVTQESVRVADVGIKEDRIVAVAHNLSAKAARAVDARGLLVFPGLVDPHVHVAHRVFMDDEWVSAADDIAESTRAAAIGGTTTVIDFALQRDLDPMSTLIARQAACENEVAIDYGLHLVLTKSEPDAAEAIPFLTTAGVTSFKLYMIYRKQGRMADDALILRALTEASRTGGLVGVHAENAAIAEFNTNRLVRLGETKPKDFPRAKPNHVEAEAINRALFLAEHAGANLYVFHLSTREGLDLVARAQARGVKVSAETCTHYLTLTDEVYSRSDGHLFFCSPPLRGAADVEALWQGIADGVIGVVSSDHCGWGSQTKERGREDFTHGPNGLPGVALRLPVIYTHGLQAGRLTLQQVASLLSTTPAKIFGLYPKKGDLAPGSDADVVLVDPERSRTVAAADGQSSIDWSPYEGMALRGWPTMTIARGEIVAEAGRFVGPQGRGRFLVRSASGSMS